MEEQTDDGILILKDLKTSPEPFFDYTSKEQRQPIIIDNGSCFARAGFGNKKTPQMVFRNLLAKPRKDSRSKNKDKEQKEEDQKQPETMIGNDIVNIEAMRFQLRTQFDKNIVTHFYLQEQIFDYVFAHLGVNTEGSVNHPIIITEAYANPNYCRSLMSELLFECYQAPSVCYGVDSLFSFGSNDNPGGTGLIVSIGANATHVIPFMDGRHVVEKSRRINVGGNNMLNYLHRLLQLKYPVHVNNITLSRIEELFYGHCSIAYDYQAALKLWSSHEYYAQHVKKIQLPFSQTAAPPTVSEADKLAKRKEMSKRLADINARKREERLAEEEDTLQRLEEILESYDEDDEEDFENSLKEFNEAYTATLSSYDDLEKMIAATKQKIDKIKQKMLSLETVPVEEKLPPPIPQPPPNRNLIEWLAEIREKKQHILEKKQTRKQRRCDLAKRRTAAAQERMRIISRLAGKEKGTDDFGMRDSDWEVYKAISRDQDSDESDNENEKLLELEDILRHHDPSENEPELQMGIAEYHQLHFSVESIRAAEVLFQPSMIGIQEAGLAETIDYVLKLFNADEQQKLVDNIFITGGLTRIEGLKERLDKELMEIRPFQSAFKVKLARDPSLDAWNGARKFAASSSNLQSYSITRSEYDEFGGEYVKEYYASNRYFPTPSVAAVSSEKVENV